MQMITYLLVFLSLPCLSKAHPISEHDDIHGMRLITIEELDRENNYTRASEHNQKLFEEVKKTMGIPHAFLRVKAIKGTPALEMSRKNYFDICNRIERFDFAVVVINKNFDELTNEEKKFIFSHELAHFLLRDERRRESNYRLVARIALIINVCCSTIMSSDSLRKWLTHLSVMNMGSLATIAGRYFYNKYKSRCHELHADLKGAELAHTQEGGISVFKKWQKDEEAYFYKKKRSWILDFYYRYVHRLCATHPLSSERIEQLEKLIKTTNQ